MTKTEIKTYKSFTWQKVKKLSQEVGCKFYSGSSSYAEYGIGLKLHSYDDTKIEVVYRSGNWGDSYIATELRRTEKQLFWKTFELYCLKNNIKYEINNEKYVGAVSNRDYIRIVEE